MDETSLHYMQTISDSSRKMGSLIDDLLAFSRMGRSEMVMAPVDLDELLKGLFTELEPEMRGRTVRWKIAELPTVKGDRNMLRLVLANLTATMALRYTAAFIDVRKSAETIMDTLPVCEVRKISYSTFTIVDIGSAGRTRVIEHGNPALLLLRGDELLPLEWAD